MPAAALKFDELLYDSLESLSLPDVYLRLREVMESDKGSMADAAEVISLDPALAARILRMANSAFYGFRSEVEKRDSIFGGPGDEPTVRGEDSSI